MSSFYKAYFTFYFEVFGEMEFAIRNILVLEETPEYISDGDMWGYHKISITGK